MADGERFNLKNPGVKRILQEVKELQSNPSDEYMSLPLEDNLFEWQFAIRGPKETEFEGGIYHGRIQLPPEYPFKPPAFMLLTPNGRFETLTKICLSISAHHPEHWQPSWSVRTALVALIAFLPTKPEGALGSLDYTKEERRTLAIKSREAAPKFGSAERQKLIDEIHSHMLDKAHPVPELVAATEEEEAEVEAKEPEGGPVQEPEVPAPAVTPEPAAPAEEPATATATATATPAPEPVRAPAATRRQQSIDLTDYGLTLMATGLAIVILAIIVKRLLRFYGYIY